MADTKQEVLRQGRNLPVAERLAVIRELAASLDEEESFWLSDEWAAVVDRRAAELDADPSQAVLWADVERRLAERIRRHVDG